MNGRLLQWSTTSQIMYKANDPQVQSSTILKFLTNWIIRQQIKLLRIKWPTTERFDNQNDEQVKRPTPQTMMESEKIDNWNRRCVKWSTSITVSWWTDRHLAIFYICKCFEILSKHSTPCQHTLNFGYRRTYYTEGVFNSIANWFKSVNI
jgi:hypothetical protein